MTGRRPRSALAALACLLAGAALLVLFEGALPVTLGVAALLAFVVLGTAAIARPSFLAEDPARDAEEAGGPS